MANWSDNTPEMQATRDMFYANYGSAAQQAWEWEDSHPGQGSYYSQPASSGSGSSSGSSSGGGSSGGGNSSGSSSGSSSGGNSGGGSNTNNNLGYGVPSQAELENYFKYRAGYDKDVLRQDMQIAKDKLDYSYAALDATSKQAKQSLDFQYAEMRQRAQTAQEQLALDTWYREQTVKIDQDKQQLDEWYKGASIDLLDRTQKLEVQKFGLQQQQFQFEQDKFQTTTGLDILKTGVQFAQNPADYVMASNYAQGIANNPLYAGAVNNLVSNTGGNARLFGAAGGAPQAASLPGMAGMMGGNNAASAGTTAADQLANGGGDGGAFDLNARAQRAQSLVNAGSQLVQRGGGALGAQALESLDPMTRGLAESGVKGAGGSWQTLVDQYNKSRVSQGSARGL